MPKYFTLELPIEDIYKLISKPLLEIDTQAFIRGMSGIDESMFHGFEFIKKNGGKYPKKTNKPCWWDRHTFETVPITIPHKIIYGKYQEVVGVHGEGNFYSFENCYAYLKEKNEISLISNLKIIFNHFYPGEELSESPDWKCLEDVGDGDMNIKTFRKSQKNISRLDNFFFIPCVVQYTF